MTAGCGLDQADGFIKAQSDIHVLDGGAACALAQVVDNCRHLHHVLVAENLDAGVVRVVFDRRVEPSVEQHGRGFKRHHLHEAAAFVVLRENFGKAFGADLLREHVREDGDRDRHALVVGAEHRVEEGNVIEFAVLLHFGQVLVGECQSVGRGSHDGFRFAGLVCEIRFVFVFGDELLAAAGITRDAVGCEVGALREDSRGNQRVHAQDKARGVAAGVRDALALGDGFALGGRKFRHPVRPVGVHAVRRGGVDHAGVRVFAEGGALDGCRIGQAQERHVGLVD